MINCSKQDQQHQRNNNIKLVFRMVLYFVFIIICLCPVVTYSNRSTKKKRNKYSAHDAFLE